MLSMAREMRLGMGSRMSEKWAWWMSKWVARNEMRIVFACLAYDIMCPMYFESKNICNYVRVTQWATDQISVKMMCLHRATLTPRCWRLFKPSQNPHVADITMIHALQLLWVNLHFYIHVAYQMHKIEGQNGFSLVLYVLYCMYVPVSSLFLRHDYCTLYQ